MGFLKHIISINDFSKEDIIKVLEVAKECEENPKKYMEGKNLATLFFEPSTRTRLSFEAAMQRLGGKVLGFADPNVSSHKKGESVQDTIRMVDRYSDVIVIRHYRDGAARAASKVSRVPIINGGDGANQHPTQTLLDLYSILKTQGTLEGLKVALVGDLKNGRTTHSLATGLSMFGCELYFVAPEELQMPKSICNKLKEKGTKYHLAKTIEEIIQQVDILYMTRIQKERFTDLNDYERVKNIFILKKEMLQGVKKNLKILHPLPRVNEIETAVDSTPYAYYFEQAAHGVPVRQALLCLVLGVRK